MNTGHRLDPELLLRQTAWLKRLATGLLGDEHEAEDVLQEMRLATLRHPPSDSERSGPWLARVARNIALRFRARRDGEARRERLVAQHEAQPSSLDLVARVSAQRRVVDAVLALAEPYRTTVLLRYFEELSAAAIAEQLGIPAATVRTRLKRALERLRERLDSEFGGRDAWGLLVVPGFKLLSASTTAATTAATGTCGAISTTSASMGVLAMSGAAKLSIAGGAIALLGAFTWITIASRSRPPVAPAEVAALDGVGEKASTTAPQIPSAQAVITPPLDVTPQRKADTDRPVANAKQIDRLSVTARALDDETREPVADAQFTLRYFRDDKVQSVSATGDSEGRIAVELARVDRRWIDFEIVAPTHAAAEGSQIPVRDEAIAQSRRLALGDVLLDRGAAITGRVVRLPQRTAVANAELLLLSRQPFVGPERFTPDSARAMGRSRSDGTFELGERAASRSEPCTVYAVTDSGVGWALVSVARGRRAIEDVEIPIEPPGRVTAHVADENGESIAGAEVTAEPHFAPLGPPSMYARGGGLFIARSRWPSLKALFVATTDATGVAVFPSLPEGRDEPLLGQYAGNMQAYTLAVRAAGFDSASQGFLLHSGADERVDVVLHRPHALAIVGRVVDDVGQPVAGATVSDSGRAESTADADGRFRLDGHPSQGVDVRLVVSAPRHLKTEWQGRIAQLGADHELPDNVHQGPGPNEITIDLTLSRLLPIRGVVQCVEGAPIADVGVSLQRYDYRGHFTTIQPVAPTTGPDGTFEFPEAGAGVWDLIVTPPRLDGGAQWYSPVVAQSVLGGDTDVVVRLARQEPGRARAIVELVDARTGAPLDPARGYASPARSNTQHDGSTSSLSAGRIVCEGLRPGAWRLKVASANGWSAERQFEIRQPEEELHLRVEMGPSAILDGRIVLDPPIPSHEMNSLTVWLFPPNGGHAVDANGRLLGDVTDGFTRPNADGSFRFVNLTPGSRTNLQIEGTDCVASMEVVVACGETKNVELRPRPAGQIHFRIASRLAPGIVQLHLASGEEPFHRAGWFSNALTPGFETTTYATAGRVRWRFESYPVERSGPDSVPLVAEGEVEVAAGATITVDVSDFH